MFLVFLLIFPVTVSSQLQISQGVTFRELNQDDGPWAIQALEINRNTPGITLEAVLGGSYILGIEPLNSIIERLTSPNRHILAGINGDFYILKADPFQGDPIGLCVVDGEMVSSPVKRSVFVILKDGSLVIDRFSMLAEVKSADGVTCPLSGINQHCPDNKIVLLTSAFNSTNRPQENATLLLAGPLPEPLKSEGKYTFSAIEKHPGDSVLPIPPQRIALVGRGSGADFLNNIDDNESIECSINLDPSPGTIQHAVGGGPRLLRNGEISIEAEQEGISQSFVDTRHPRTALGYNDDSIFLVTVDGRQEGYSAGMSLPELAALLKKLGAKEAINMDGGGSTTMWVTGTVRNRPSDGMVRPIANGILLYSADGQK
ncbi:MAG: phosphodiester glycosidase family protein [Candidatus Latescibacteria bacterium]|nr:phosphodiester glycosidase family protein [Candidatus Latescibacterota bacterium]